jgi:anti-sigma-K factor RskA
MNYSQPELRRALAADYVIGLMPGTARRRFERLLQDDQSLRGEVAQWQETLATLTTPLSDQPVPERVWQAIVARIEPQHLHVPEKRPFWNWLRIGALACSLLLATVLGVLYNRDNATLRATLVADNQQPALRIRAYDSYLKVEPLNLAGVQADRSLELWVIPADGKPVSLGVLPRDGDGQLQLSDAQRKLVSAPTTLAITLEPQGGSPTGGPTGPVLYQGKLAAL